MSLSLESSITLPCGVKIKNRIAKSAMSENMADRNHNPTARFSRLFSRWAVGGAGLVITGNIMVDVQALGEPRNIVIDKNFTAFQELEKWAAIGTKNNTHLWAQLNHPGKQSPKYLSDEPVSASSVKFAAPLDKVFACPRAMSEQEILETIDKFTNSAVILKKAGFTGIQIHGAHGYLVSQFLSPIHNIRTDKWGGNLENRMRFVVSIYKSLREALGADFPIAIKLNSADFSKGGFSESDSIEVLKCLNNLGIDLIEISGGTYESSVMMGNTKNKLNASTLKREAYFLEFATKAKKHLQAPLMLTGGFRTKAGMNQAIKSGVDLIGLARSLAIDPEFANKILSNKEVKSPVKMLTTGFKQVDKIVPIEIIWYTNQLLRIGNGKNPDPKLGVWKIVLKTIFKVGLSSLKRVRV